MPIASTVHPIHFEDYSSAQFEHVVFACHVCAGWRELIWHGQSGGDQGRDISGVEEFDDLPARKTLIECANRDTLTLAKACADMEKAVVIAGGKPDTFKFVCRGAVSDASRTRIVDAAAALGVEHVTIWSSVDFEENLRLRGECLLHRFVRGIEFPEAKADIRKFVDDFPERSDADALDLMASVFDRPAFRMPFQQESSLPVFQQAVETPSAPSTPAFGEPAKAWKSGAFPRSITSGTSAFARCWSRSCTRSMNRAASSSRAFGKARFATVDAAIRTALGTFSAIELPMKWMQPAHAQTSSRLRSKAASFMLRF